MDTEAKFDEETGEALNDAARRLVETATSCSQAQVSKDSTAHPRGILSNIPEVEIAEGKWKYVQINLSLPGEPSKLVVRSLNGVQYHAHVYDEVMKVLRPKGIEGQVIGGGRIEHYPGQQKVNVYGYSKTFGRTPGCNQKSAELIRIAFPQFDVNWSDSGY